MGTEGVLHLREHRGSQEVMPVPVEECRLVQRHCFLSHAQAEAQNQVGLLAELLYERGVQAWYDMSAERLEVPEFLSLLLYFLSV